MRLYQKPMFKLPILSFVSTLCLISESSGKANKRLQAKQRQAIEIGFRSTNTIETAENHISQSLFKTLGKCTITTEYDKLKSTHDLSKADIYRSEYFCQTIHVIIHPDN